MKGLKLYSPRVLLTGGVLALSLLGGSLFAGQSHAAYTICRTDPIVSLSDGSTVTMFADISDDPSDVQAVSYELHVPAGVYPTGMTYDQYGAIESVDIVDDQAPATYSVGITVTTGTAGMKFQGNASVTGLVCRYPGQQSIGYSNGAEVWYNFSC